MSALGTWQERREFLLDELAKAQGAAKFAIRKELEKAETMIAQLEAEESGSSAGDAECQVDVIQVTQYVTDFVGRRAELDRLESEWAACTRGEADRARVLTLVALGGEGKTALVARWLATMAEREWPDCETAFAWSFHSQGTRDLTTSSSDLFLAEALRFFGDPVTADSSRGPYEKGRRLAELVGGRRALLMLDGVEPLQYPPGPPHDGALSDPGLLALLKGLAARNTGLCVVTTRYSVPDTGAFRTTTAPELPITRLGRSDGVALLRSLGVVGAGSALEGVVERVAGHALALTVLGSYLRDAHGGNVAHADRIEFSDADRELQGGLAFRVMDTYTDWLGSNTDGTRARAVLRLTGLFDRPITHDCLTSLTQPPVIDDLTEPLTGLDGPAINLVLSRLERARLLTAHRDPNGDLISVDAHPLVREYFAHRLRHDHPDSWVAGHRRLYDHLTTTTDEGQQPGLEDLQPLYQAVVHGCRANHHQATLDDTYYDRITLGNEAYSVKKLGAWAADLAAVTAFFTTPWTTPHPTLNARDQNWLISEAGFRLRALGRLNDATGPLTTGHQLNVDGHDWKNAAISAQNLAAMWIDLGGLDTALDWATTAIDHANQIDDLFEQLSAHASRGAVHHRRGGNDTAAAEFDTAHQLHTQHQPNRPWMYSLRGFQQCEVLLAPAELAAWTHPTTHGRFPHDELVSLCDHVTERALDTLTIATRNRWLTDIGLDQLTIARAHLYQSVVTNTQPTIDYANTAIHTLRTAGEHTYLIAGLLTRAWTHTTLGHTAESIADLDDAHDLAQRGPMQLHLTDIHLHRAHLHHHTTPYPWTTPNDDLTSAQHHIETTSYHLRTPHLQHTQDLVEA